MLARVSSVIDIVQLLRAGLMYPLGSPWDRGDCTYILYEIL